MVNVKGTPADVVDSFIVEEDRDISVVRLNDRGGDGQTELGLFPIVDREPLEEK